MPLDIVRFIQALLMSVLWNNIQFHNGENNCEAIVIAAGGLGDAVTLSQQAIFSIESPPYESLSSPYCYLKKKRKLLFSLLIFRGMATPQSAFLIDQTLMDHCGKSGKSLGGVSRAKLFFFGGGGGMGGIGGGEESFLMSLR